MMFIRDIFKWVYTNRDGYERNCPCCPVCPAVAWRAAIFASWAVPPGAGGHPRHRVRCRLYWPAHDVSSILLKWKPSNQDIDCNGTLLSL